MKEEAQNDHDKKPCENENLKTLFTYLYEDLNQVKSEKDRKKIIDTSLNFIYNIDAGPKGGAWIKRFKASIYETEIPKSLLTVDVTKSNADILKKIDDIGKIDKKNLEESIKEIINTGWENQINLIEHLCTALKNRPEPVRHLIIYEAPPSKIDITNSSHVGDFILDVNSTSPYKNAIFAAFDKTSENILSNLLEEKNTYFTDIIPVPIPFNPTIRKAWATEDKFNIERKQLTVHLFEEAIIKFANKFKGKIDKDLIIAIGMPRNTSAALYDYYSSKVHYVIDCADGICIVDKKPVFCGYLFKIDLTKTNAVLATKKINIPTLKGITLPLFESCFVDTSGQPNGTLLKIALGLEIK
jgi:hypothetical protein